MWCSSTRVCQYQGYKQRHSLKTSVAAIDAALALSNDDSSTISQPDADLCPTNETEVSKVNCLLKRRLQLCETESQIKTAVGELIKKYRTEEQLTDRTSAVHGMCDTVTKYSCYSATCITRTDSQLSSPCYSSLCRCTQEQTYSCKVYVPGTLQDLCRLSYVVSNTDDDSPASESAISQNDAAESSCGLNGKSQSVRNNIVNSCDQVTQQVDDEQSVGSKVSENRTRICDTTKELRLLAGLLQRHICNRQIHLTQVLVCRLKSLLDTKSDSRHPVCLRGTVRKLSRKESEIPIAHDFKTRSRRQSVFVLVPSTLRHLARSGGMLFTVPGFSPIVSTKTDSGWIYLSPRPLFCTAWRYRTASACNLSAVALQLRILWCCIRWDDMSSDASLEDVTVASENDVVTKTTILRRRDVGPDGLRSEYLVRRVSAHHAADDDWHGK